MTISYDYEELIQELKKDVSDGALSLTDTIQILRGRERFGYQPIIDWYLDEEKMIELLKIDIFDDLQEIKETKQLKEQYEKDKPNLSIMAVRDVIIEMEERSKIL